jgi:hypothetical protein
MQVLQRRFQIISKDPRHYEALRDLGSAVFSILQHTPIKALGLNRAFHYKMSSVEAWHSLGHRLAPKADWDPVISGAGLKSLVVQGKRKSIEAAEGNVHIKVEPSPEVEYGVFIEVNEDVRIPGGGADWVVAYLAKHWDDVLAFSERTAEHLLGLV